MPQPFVHDSSLTFPRLTQVNLPSGRVYRVETGEFAGDVLPSITRVLGHKPKPQLEEWKERVGAEEASKISARATITGSNLHKLAECYLGNDTLPRYSPFIAELWWRLRPWVDSNITRVYAQETDVCSFKLGVAGRMDLLAGYRGEPAIVDFKQALKPKKEEYVEDYKIQGTFYACAVYEITGLLVKHIVIPVVSPDELQVFITQPTKHFTTLRERILDFYIDYAAPGQIEVDTEAQAVV